MDKKMLSGEVDFRLACWLVENMHLEGMLTDDECNLARAELNRRCPHLTRTLEDGSLMPRGTSHENS